MDSFQAGCFFIVILLQGILAQHDYQDRQDGLNSVWTAWSNWGACSKTCGKGMKMRHRDCVGHSRGQLVRLDHQTCPGQKKEHVMCNLGDCPTSMTLIDERVALCKEKNKQEVFGNFYNWEPFTKNLNPCELTCVAVGYSFYYNFGKIKDGTSCTDTIDKMCIGGHCTAVGCDGKVGSNAMIDKCRVCGGKNINCTFIRDSFTKEEPNGQNFGYNEVTIIPKGATYIEVHDNSSNYLALADANKGYIINGNWVINSPGEYEVAGTIIHYKRTWDNNETITAMGPTEENLHLMLIFRHNNPGVQFSYWIPRDKAPKPIYPVGDDSFAGDSPKFYGKGRPTDSAEIKISVLRSDTHEVLYPRDNVGGNNYESVRRNGGEGTQYKYYNGYYYPNPESKILGQNPSENKQAGNEDPQSRLGYSTGKKNQNAPTYPDNGEGIGLNSNSHRRRHSEDRTDTVAAISNPQNPDTSHGNHHHGHHRQAYIGTFRVPAGCSSICSRVNKRNQHFCESDFVVRGKVLDFKYIGEETRYDIKIMDKYKDNVNTLEREYVWVPNKCRCPRILAGKEYVMMGNMVEKGPRELRLQLTEESYVRSFTRNSAGRYKSLRKHNCKKR